MTKIWYAENDEVALPLFGSEKGLLEQLIQECGSEQLAALSWNSYVFAEPKPYHLQPIERVDIAETKDGRKYKISGEDEGAITKFPFLAFLRKPEGWVIHARHILATHKHLPERFLRLFQEQSQ